MSLRAAYNTFRAEPTVRRALERIFSQIGFLTEDAARKHISETVEMVEELFPEARGVIALYNEDTLENLGHWTFGR